MSRYAVSGASTVAISPATASSNQSIGITPTSGRVFWLRGIWVQPEATTGPLHIIDATVGSTATAIALAIPLRVRGTDTALTIVGSGYQATATAITVTITATGDVKRSMFPHVHEFSAPGIKFTTGPVARMSASGSIAAGEIGCWGYEG